MLLISPIIARRLMNPDPPPDTLIGTQLGGYVIEALLGKGAMGAVYRAVQVSLNRHVALKVMAGHLVGSEESAARFWREARAAAAINHPNLVQVYDFGEANGTYFYAMELVDGLSLGAYLRRGDRFSERECIEVGREVTMALRAAHRAGVIHRDLKPDNLMLNSEGVVKVADLGVARFRQMDGGEDSLTLTGVGVGTPAFMSPEQIRGGKAIDHRCDFYALGATLFQLATCRLPFPGQTVGEILEKQFTATVPRARDVNPALGDAFSNLVARLMAKDPAARPQTHEEILVALEGCLRVVTGEEGGASRIRMADSTGWAWPARLLRLWPVWAGTAAVLAVSGLLMMRGPKATDPWERLQMAEGRPPVADAAAKGTAGAPLAPGVPGPGRETAGTAETTGDAKASAVVPEAPGSRREATPPAGAVQPPPSAVAKTAGPGPSPSAPEITGATKDKPFVNSLGMKFVPIKGTKVLFCIWETRVRDFEAFIKDSGCAWTEKPPFEQGPEHPVVMVSWDDAKAFCEWLSKKEGVQYRLPTDEEWDAAVGTAKYPWGDDCPPPPKVDNIGGEEAMLGNAQDPKAILKGYRDEHPRTAPVGGYKATKAGLYDMGGNVREWVEDWYTEAHYKKSKAGGGSEPKAEDMATIKKGNVRRVSRGGYWTNTSTGGLVSSARYPLQPGVRSINIGFRCVLVTSSPAPASSGLAPVSTGAARISPGQPTLSAPTVTAQNATAGASALTAATQERPFVNSLGMKFVPIPGTKVLFSVWETRVKDYEAFVKDSGRNRSEAPDFEQGPDHPVVKVTWDDAKAFCAWLSQKEGLEYRLPTDDEWSAAVGGGQYPWGDEWLPPDGVENIGGEESKIGKFDDPGKVLVKYRDAHPRTSPVGSYRANRLGLFDMGGNAREWTEDWYTEAVHEKHKADGGGGQFTPEQMEDVKKGNVYRVARGCYWRIAASGLLKSSFRHPQPAGDWTGNGIGFRCVLAVAPDISAASGAAPLVSASESVRGNVNKTVAPSPSLITRLSSATKDRPFVNSLGMKFVPVPRTKVLFSVWETRVKDFEAFVKESGYDWSQKPPFEQGPDHPVVNVSWDDAKAFCAWLSKKEGMEYRLPTDEEWDAAVGEDKYPWGDEWPPPKGVENIGGEESVLGNAQDTKQVLKGFRDEHPRSAPVGSYRMNRLGLYDVGGNVREWVEDWYTETMYDKHTRGGGSGVILEDLSDIKRGNVRHVMRGGAWSSTGSGLLLSCGRLCSRGDVPGGRVGFRCVVVASSGPAPVSTIAPQVSRSQFSPPPVVTSAQNVAARTPALSSATKDKPFVNSLGMKFVPIPGTKVLFSIWETRVRDFEAFVKESGYNWAKKPPFEQGPDHPVVMVSWYDVNAFCAWLSKKEGVEYRLPTDEEWDAAVGKETYPWGEDWPPPKGSVNIGGEEGILGQESDPKGPGEGYRDDHPRTAPVGSYSVSKLGLYDMGGNVREWVQDWYTEAIYKKHRAGHGREFKPDQLVDVKRGNVCRALRSSYWADVGSGVLVSSARHSAFPAGGSGNAGFRCVLVLP